MVIFEVSQQLVQNVTLLPRTNQWGRQKAIVMLPELQLTPHRLPASPRDLEGKEPRPVGFVLDGLFENDDPPGSRWFRKRPHRRKEEPGLIEGIRFRSQSPELSPHPLLGFEIGR